MSNETNANPNAVSRISEGMSILKGEIFTSHDARFDGYFEGKITSKSRIIIGETATIKGDIVCANLDVWGTFKGVAYVQDTLALKKGGVYSGQINTGKFVVELGSRFDGTSRMITEEDFQKAAKESEQSMNTEAAAVEADGQAIRE